MNFDKLKFECYYNIQQSGITNMFDKDNVIELSKQILNEHDCLDIMKNYESYLEQYEALNERNSPPRKKQEPIVPNAPKKSNRRRFRRNQVGTARRRL